MYFIKRLNRNIGHNNETFKIFTTSFKGRIGNLQGYNCESLDMNTEGRVSQGSYRFDNVWMLTPVINLLF